MARLNEPIRKTYAIFVRNVSEHYQTFLREPYNIVSLDFGDGAGARTFIEPTCGRPLSPLERGEVYDGVRFFDTPPYPACRIGYAR